MLGVRILHEIEHGRVVVHVIRIRRLVVSVDLDYVCILCDDGIVFIYAFDLKLKGCDIILV